MLILLFRCWWYSRCGAQILWKQAGCLHLFSQHEAGLWCCYCWNKRHYKGKRRKKHMQFHTIRHLLWSRSSFVTRSHMWVISTPAAPPHVVPHRIGSKWEGNALSPARDRPASELCPQCRFTIWRWRGQTLPAQRYKLKKVQICPFIAVYCKLSNIILINVQLHLPC